MAIAAAVIVATFVVVQSLALSPDQMLARDLGRHGASVGFGTKEIAPGSLEMKFLVTDLSKAGFAEAMPTLTTVGARHDARGVVIREGDWRRNPLPERYSLVSGDWPDEPGEVVVAVRDGESKKAAGAKIGLLSERMPLRVVGVAEDRYTRDATTLLVGSGTWAAVSESTKAQFPAVSAFPVIFWDGRREAKMVQAFADSLGVSTARARESLVRAPDVVNRPDSPVKGNPLAYAVPSIAVPLLGALACVALVWPVYVRGKRKLVEAGAPPHLARWSTTAAQVLPLCTATVVGTVVGAGLAIVVRPLLGRWHDQPLSPVQFPWGPLLNLGAANLLVLVLLVLLPGGSHPSKPTTNKSRFSTSARDLRRWLAIVAAVGAIVSFPRATSVTSAMLFSVACIALVAAAAPDLLSMALRLRPRRDVRVRLAARQLAAMPSAAQQLVLVTTLIGCAVAFTTLLSTMIATMDDRQKPEVSTGQIKISDRASPVLPLPVQARKALLGTGAVARSVPVQLYFAVAGTRADPVANEVRIEGAPGLVVAVDTLTQVRSLLGTDWTPTLAKTLANGGAVRWLGREERSATGTVTLIGPGRSPARVNMDVVARPRPDVQWANGASALTLTKTARTHHLPLSDGALILTDVEPGLGKEIRDRYRALGLDPDVVLPYQAPPTPIPNAALISTAVLLGLTTMLFTSGASMARVRELRPAAGALLANGVSPRWARQVLLWQEGTLLFAGTVLGLAAGAIPVLVSIPQFAGWWEIRFPWGQILCLLLACVLASCLAGGLAARRIRPELLGPD